MQNDVLNFFTQKTPLYVFATRRKINAFYLARGDGFLPYAMSASEFFKSVVFVQGLKEIPKNIRKVFLLCIISEMLHSGQDFERKLVFEKSFLGYLESSSFLFNFFDELRKFLVDFKEIPLKDTYGDYEEHLEILFEIYRKYQEKLTAFGFFDIPFEQDYEILEDFFDKFSCIEFYLDGFLSTQERNILHKIAKLLPVFVHIECDMYNKEHFDFLKVSLEEGFDYKIDWKTSEILSQVPLNTVLNVEIFGFSSRINQCALVFERVNEWLEEGIDPQKIAIITPDEAFSKYLKLLDKYHNLNFAMGKEIQNLAYVQNLKEKLKFCKENHFSSDLHPLEWLRQESEILLKNASEREILERFRSEILMSYEKITQSLDKFLPEEILELYLLDLSDFRIDDVSGGKVRVMGVLESRGLSFERVVIVDFNDDFVPSLKDSDMFLNTKIRKSLQIPTLKDRQDLQKHYYLQILNNTQKVDIAFVDTENLSYSKMIDELDLAGKICNGDEKYRIFPFNQEKIHKQEKFVDCLPQDFKFSATKINTFLSCKRKFYYAYLKKLQSPENTNANIGEIIHNLLKQSYTKFEGKIPQIELIKQEVTDQIECMAGISAMDRIKLQLAIKELDAFWKNEIERVETGIAVLGCEKDFETKIGEFVFSGRIDRIDTFSNKIFLIDYKFKSELKVDTEEDLEESCDFQLPVYLYGAKALGYDGEIEGYFYDLKKGEFRKEEVLEQKAKILERKLKIFDDEIDFEMTQEKKNCKYCCFVDICGIDI